jgi:hypothetical protein
MKSYAAPKRAVLEFQQALSGATPETVSSILEQHLAPDYHWYGVYPFNEQHGPQAVAEAFWIPFLKSWASVQRRPDVLLAGTSEIDQTDWVISMGHLMGLLDRDWLGIPATRKMAFLRYAEFQCVEDGKLVRGAFFCDLIGVMQQTGVSPLPPQTGASFLFPGPRTHDGLLLEEQDPRESRKTLDLVNRMIADLSELNVSGDDLPPPEFLARTWHEDMIWYGPAGIGATYTIPRYQEQHQYPFRTGLTGKRFNGHLCRFAEGNYAGFFGWPNLTNTPSGGFLGLPGSEIAADMRVVDIYRRAGERLAENWVFIDLPWWLKQQGLDLLERTRNIMNPEG